MSETQLGHLVVTCGCWRHESRSRREIVASVQSASSRVLCFATDQLVAHSRCLDLVRRNHGRGGHAHSTGIVNDPVSLAPTCPRLPPATFPCEGLRFQHPAHLPSGSMRQTAGRHIAQIPVKPPSPSTLALVGQHGILSTLESDRC